MQRRVDNETMKRSDENRFEPRPRGSRGRRAPADERFVTRVLREASRAGHLPALGVTPKRSRVVKCSRIGRGHAAAQFAGARLGLRSRRVVTKTRIVKLGPVTLGAVVAHLRYIIRGGVGYDGQPGQLYGRETDAADSHEFAARGRNDRHQFRIILAPEDGIELTDLRTFTRDLMRDMERDLGTRLEWVAVDHWELPIDKQVTTIGATWLDRQLVTEETSLGTAGFGATVKEALRAREDFLVEHGFAQRDHHGVRLPRNLLAMLRERELEGVAKTLATDTGLNYRPLADGQSASGVYRQMISTASGRFAMLDDGLGFSLVPWGPVLEKRVGQTMGVTMHGDQIIWSFGRQRGLSR